MPEKPLTEEEKQFCKELFEALDGDGDGQIDHDDFKSALEKAGLENVQDAEVKKLLKVADKDNTGKVSWDEFLKCCATRPLKKRILKAVFEELDADNTGSIDAKDIKAVLEKAGYDTYSDDEIEQLIAAADKSGDGKITFSEFENAMNKMLAEAS